MSRFPALPRSAASCIVLCLGLLGGCGRASDITGDLRPPTTGSLSLVIEGLPPGSAPLVSVTNAQGFHKSIAGSQTLTGLHPGQYTITALDVLAGEDRYAPTLPIQTAVVTPGSTSVPIGVGYAAVTGRLHVALDSVPAGAVGALQVTGPNGYSRTLADSATLAGLAPGQYDVVASTLVVAGELYDPVPASQSVMVTASGTSTTAAASVRYSRKSGRMALAVSGLPAGTGASIQVTGPGGYSQAVTGSITLSGLVPGSYVVSAAPVTASGNTYRPGTGLVSVSIVASQQPENVAIVYALATGSLQISLTGLPGGTSGAATVSGPAGFSVPVTGSTLLTGLEPGDYSISANSVTVGTAVYVAAPSTQSVTVAASLTPLVRTVSYSPGVGSLSVTIAGLPGGAAASVVVAGPGGFQQVLSGSQQLDGLNPGSYTVSASSVTVAGVAYSAVPPTQTVSVTTGSSLAASITYAPSAGGLAITVSGLPGGSPASLLVTGPGGYSQAVTGSQSLSALAPGSYTIAASSVSASGTVYVPSPSSQTKSVTAGGSAAASVTYTASTGGLSVTVTGLPGGTAAAVQVSGPGGFSQAITSTQTLSGLSPGSYSVTASAVVSGGVTYNPAPVSQSRSVSAGAVATATVGYTAASSATLNLSIGGVYLTQATQTFDGAVPLVAGRDAYLRVFALSDQANSAQPQVRARLYNGGSLVQTYTISAPGSGVPTAVNEGLLNSSWNVLVPGALVQPGLQILADVDPSGGISETSESDNQFPVGGTPGAVDVRSLPVFSLRFVPVLQQVNGLQGNITDANKEAFLTEAKATLPIGAYSADVRAVYTTTAPALDAGNSSGAWGTILSEVLALRTADGSSRYYFGVVKTSYGSGVVGLGYVGGNARSALGWDVPSSAPHTVAHELGHNMSRPHAPCGGPASPDPSYPYAGGVIGVWGLDVATLSVKSPSLADLMGYCSPTWISDYNWRGMMTYRQGGSNNAPPAAGVSGDTGLLIWGRITGAGIVLEPAFRVAISAAGLPISGPNRLELLAGDGSTIRSVAFAASEVVDVPGDVERHFAFVLPLDAATEQRIATLRVVSGGRAVARRAQTFAAASEPAPDLARDGSDRVRVQWNAAQFPMVMVRDARTGQILSFARGGSARLWSQSSDFQLIFSDGVKSVTRPGRVLR